MQLNNLRRSPPTQEINGETMYSVQYAAQLAGISRQMIIGQKARLRKNKQYDQLDRYFYQKSTYHFLVRQAYIDEHIDKKRPTSEYISIKQAAIKLNMSLGYFHTMAYNARKIGDNDTFIVFCHICYVKKTHIEKIAEHQKLQSRLCDMAFDLAEHFNDDYRGLAHTVRKTGIFANRSTENIEKVIDNQRYQNAPKKWMEAYIKIEENIKNGKA